MPFVVMETADEGRTSLLDWPGCDRAWLWTDAMKEALDLCAGMTESEAWEFINQAARIRSIEP